MSVSETYEHGLNAPTGMFFHHRYNKLSDVDWTNKKLFASL